MQNSVKSNLRFIALGALISFVFIVPVLVHNGYFQPIPYKRVSLNSFEMLDDGGAVLSASFEKMDGSCVFDELVASGKTLSGWEEVPWNDPRPPSVEDRLAGPQTLRIWVGVDPAIHSQLAILTRHDCGGEKVDKTFILLRSLDTRKFPSPWWMI